MWCAAQLLANREGTLALLSALRTPEPSAPLHQPRLHRPNLQLLSPLAPEADSASARRVANRARQLQSQLKIGHHAAFRLAEGEAAEPERRLIRHQFRARPQASAQPKKI